MRCEGRCSSRVQREEANRRARLTRSMLGLGESGKEREAERIRCAWLSIPSDGMWAMCVKIRGCTETQTRDDRQFVNEVDLRLRLWPADGGFLSIK